MAEKPPASPPGKGAPSAKGPQAAGKPAAKPAPKPAGKPAAKSGAKGKKGGKAGKKKGLPKSFYIVVTLVFVLPAVALLTWYAYEVLGVFSKHSQQALDRHAQELAQKTAAFAKRAAKEGFEVKDFDACAQIKNQYVIPMGIVYTEFTQRQLVGLSKFASDEEVKDRCIQFAKSVARMEKLSHHLRHVYVCNEARFVADKAGHYYLTADAKGQGVVQHFGSSANLTPIPPGQSILMRGWQIYNQGDGCLIIGMSKSGIFTFSGGVMIEKPSGPEVHRPE